MSFGHFTIRNSSMWSVRSRDAGTRAAASLLNLTRRRHRRNRNLVCVSARSSHVSGVSGPMSLSSRSDFTPVILLETGTHPVGRHSPWRTSLARPRSCHIDPCNLPAFAVLGCLPWIRWQTHPSTDTKSRAIVFLSAAATCASAKAPSYSRIPSLSSTFLPDFFGLVKRPRFAEFPDHSAIPAVCHLNVYPQTLGTSMCAVRKAASPPSSK